MSRTPLPRSPVPAPNGADEPRSIQKFFFQGDRRHLTDAGLSLALLSQSKTIPHLPFGKSTLWIGTDTLGRSLVNAAVGSPAVKEYGKEEVLKGHKVWAVSNAQALKLAEAGK